MISLIDLQSFSELMPKLYTPRSLLDFPDHVFSFLVKLLDLDAADRDQIEHRFDRVPAPSTPAPPNGINVGDSFSLKTFSISTNRKVNRSIDRFPLFQHYFHQHQSTATKISDFAIESNLYRLEGVYWRFLKPIELEDRFSKISIDPTNPTIVHAIYLLEADVICFTVSRSLREWTERDRYLLDLIRPHLIQAHRNAIVLTEIQAGLDCQDCNCRQLSSRSLSSSVSAKAPAADGALPNRSSAFLVAGDAQVQLMSQLQAHQVSSFSIESIRSIGLTKREAEVLYLIAKDKSNGEIAKLLDCSLSTVKKHLEHIYAKLEVQSRTAAVINVLSQLGSIDT